MVFDAFRKPSGPSLETMIGHVTEMLGHARHTFDLAMSTLVAGADPSALGHSVVETDRTINELEREIRREIVVHAGVHGTADVTVMLILLMVSRKVERIGDNCKNIYDLATYGVDLREGPDREHLVAAREEISTMIGDAAEIFRVEDEQRAGGFLDRTRELQGEYDATLAALVTSGEYAPFGVPRALLYRYLKRIVANLEGVVAAVVQPLDLIDFDPDGTEGGRSGDDPAAGSPA